MNFHLLFLVQFLILFNLYIECCDLIKELVLFINSIGRLSNIFIPETLN